MWLTGRLVPDHKTIADFRKDNGHPPGLRPAALCCLPLPSGPSRVLYAPGSCNQRPLEVRVAKLWSWKMLFWLYEIPALSVVGLFTALFVGLCWLGIFLVRPFARASLD